MKHLLFLTILLWGLFFQSYLTTENKISANIITDTDIQFYSSVDDIVYSSQVFCDIEPITIIRHIDPPALPSFPEQLVQPVIKYEENDFTPIVPEPFGPNVVIPTPAPNVIPVEPVQPVEPEQDIQPYTPRRPIVDFLRSRPLRRLFGGFRGCDLKDSLNFIYVFFYQSTSRKNEEFLCQL